MQLFQEFKKRVQHLKGETFALYLAARHPDTPWYAKAFVAFVVAYAFSPIDLIPDFVPVLGYLDELILIPLGIAIAIKMIPPPVLAECRARAQASMASGKPVSRIAAAVIIGIWVLLAALCALWAYEAFAIGNQHRPRHYAATRIGATCFTPISFRVSPMAETTLRISLASIAPMQPTRNVSTCVSLPG